jgi:zinc-binding alcohol dehydrogenase family protein
MERGAVRPVIDSEWTLERAPAAFARLAEGTAFGKVVVTRNESPGAAEAVAWAEAALRMETAGARTA